MPLKPRSAEYFDGWYADRVATSAVDEIMSRHMGFPPGTRAGVVPAQAVAELARRRKAQPVNDGVNKTDRILGVHVIVDRLRQQQKLVPREARNVSHTRF